MCNILPSETKGSILHIFKCNHSISVLYHCFSSHCITTRIGKYTAIGFYSNSDISSNSGSYTMVLSSAHCVHSEYGQYTSLRTKEFAVTMI